MAGAAAKHREPANAVHQNAILCETIAKENRYQVMYKDYSVNPFKRSKHTYYMYNDIYIV